MAVLCALFATCADVAVFLHLEVAAAGAVVKEAQCDRCQQRARMGLAVIIMCDDSRKEGVVLESGVLNFAYL